MPIQYYHHKRLTQIKAGLSSSLMSGSNAVGEPMPLLIMFCDAVNASWLVGLPRLHALFGHEEEQCFPATVTTNERGGTDSRVHAQVLH